MSGIIVKRFSLLLVISALFLSGCGTFNLTDIVGLQSVEAVSTPVKASEDVQAEPIPLPVVDTDLLGIEQALIAIYERTNPSVVFIDVSSDQEQAGLADFGSGSGFIYDGDGHVVTNNHVVEGADGIRVTFSDGSVFNADVVGSDIYSDLAVLKVDLPAGFSPLALPLADSDALRVGQFVVAIGNPFGLSGSMTTGIISALGRTLPTQSTQGGTYSNPLLIQTDAAINPGNSGGPLIDMAGRVIGINSAIRTSDGNNTGVGFAIPVNTVKIVVPQLIEKGEVTYPYLGITANTAVTLADLALEYDLPTTTGVLIAEVTPGGPAAKAGLQGGNEQVTYRGYDIYLGGDIIVMIDGVPIHDFDQLLAYLVTQTQVGDEITLTAYRGEEMIEVSLTLESRPE